jgi:hypothetical protein
MASVQQSWSAAGYQGYESPQKQQDIQAAAIDTAYAYSYAPQGINNMSLPVMYEWDPYYQTSQHAHAQQQWNYPPIPYGAPHSQSTMMQMPSPTHGQHSIPTSPIAWPQSPQFWQSVPSQGPQGSQQSHGQQIGLFEYPTWGICF